MSEFIVDNNGLVAKTNEREMELSHLLRDVTSELLLPKSTLKAIGAITVLDNFAKAMSNCSENEKAAVYSAIKKSTTLARPTLILAGVAIIGAIAYIWYKESKGQPVKKVSVDLKGFKFSCEFET